MRTNVLLRKGKMIKIYLKKLLQTFLFLTALIVLTALLSTLLMTVFLWLKPQIKAAIVYFSLFLSAILLICAVFQKRYENKRLKATYLEAQTAEDYSFRNDYLATFKSKENVAHTLAFFTIVSWNSIRIATTTRRSLAGLLLQLVILLVMLSVLNTLIWCLVHRRWIKSRTGTK